MTTKFGFNPFTNNFDMMSVEDLSEYAKLAIETTHDNLYNNLIANSLLIVNQWYKVTDYKTYALIAGTNPSAPEYYEGAEEIILLRATSVNTVAGDGYSLSYPGEKIVFKQNMDPITGAIDGGYSDGSYGLNEISNLTKNGFTIDDGGHHFNDKLIAEGYNWYLEAYDSAGGTFYDYGEGVYNIYAYIDSNGVDLNNAGIKVTSATTFHIENRGLKISDYAEDDSFYINLYDGNNEVNLTIADLGTRFTFDDNGDFVWIDTETSLDLTQIYSAGGYIEMGYNATTTRVTGDNDGVIAIPDQGVLYLDWKTIYNSGSTSAVSQFVLYFEPPKPLAKRKAGTLSGTFYDPINDETVTINDANEGIDWSYDPDTYELTLLTASLFDWNNVDFSDQSNFDVYFEIDAFDFTRGPQDIYMVWYYVQRVINGVIVARENTPLNFQFPADYRGRRVRRYKPVLTPWSSGTYTAGAVVEYGGNLYVCFALSTGNNPSDSAAWSILMNNANEYKMPRKDFSLRIQTTMGGNVTATILYDPASYSDVEYFPTTEMETLNDKLNLKIEATTLNPDVWIASSANLARSNIKLYSEGVVSFLSSFNDCNVTIGESIVNYCTFTTGFYTQCWLWQTDSFNAQFLGTSYVRYINKSSIIFGQDCYFGASAQGNIWGYLINYTTYGNQNNNYNFIAYGNGLLIKKAFSYNLISADFSRLIFNDASGSNNITGTFSDSTFAGFSNNNLSGTIQTWTVSALCSGNTFKGSSLRNTLKVFNGNNVFLGMNDNNCPNIDWTGNNFYGTFSNNTGQGQGSVRYNTTYTAFGSNNFVTGKSNIDIRNNTAQSISTNTFNYCNVAYNYFGNRLDSCTFQDNHQFTYNTIFNQVLSSNFGSAGITRNFSYNAIYGVETCTMPFTFQENHGFDTLSSYTSTKTMVNRVYNRNTNTFFSVGYMDLEKVHSAFQVYGAIATAYLSTVSNNTITKALSTIANFHTANRDQTLPLLYSCDGREHTIQNIGSSTTTIKTTTENKTVTFTISSPCVATATANLLTNLYKVQFTTTGALPTGLSTSTNYWIGVINANTFYIYPTLQDARSATNRINTSGTQSGTHTLVTKDTINGSDTYVLSGLNESVICIAPNIGSDWKIKANYIPNISTVVGGGLSISGSQAFPYRAITALRTLDATDYTIDCTANTFTVTLPTAVNITGRIYNIKNSGTGIITLATTSSQTIDGITTQTLYQYDNINVQSTGANWIII
jgi:hypothetical protein